MMNDDKLTTPSGDEIHNAPIEDSNGPTLSPKITRRKPWIAIVVIIIVIALAGIAYYLLTNSRSPRSTPSPSVATTTPAKQRTASEIIDQVHPQLSGNVQTLADQKQSNKFLLNLFDYGYKVAGYDYYVSSSMPFGVGSRAESSVAEKNYATIKQAMSDNGLRALDDKTYNTAEAGHIVIYASKTVVCDIAHSEVTDYVNGQTVATGKSDATVTCSNITDYSAVAAQIKPLYTAYVSAVKPQQRYENIQFGGTPSLKDSSVAGYKTAQVGMSSYGALVGSSAALFYQTPDKVWHYFTNTQSELACSEFSTSDLLNAYAGTECFDDATQKSSTVVAAT